jgi:hypothetical protein
LRDCSSISIEIAVTDVKNSSGRVERLQHQCQEKTAAGLRNRSIEVERLQQRCPDIAAAELRDCNSLYREAAATETGMQQHLWGNYNHRGAIASVERL